MMSIEQHVSAYSEAIIGFYNVSLVPARHPYLVLRAPDFTSYFSMYILPYYQMDEISTSNKTIPQITSTSQLALQNSTMASEQAETCCSIDIIDNKYQSCLTTLPTPSIVQSYRNPAESYSQNSYGFHNLRSIKITGQSQWPRGLRRRSTVARLLRSWVRIPPRAWMFVL